LADDDLRQDSDSAIYGSVAGIISQNLQKQMNLRECVAKLLTEEEKRNKKIASEYAAAEQERLAAEQEAKEQKELEENKRIAERRQKAVEQQKLAKEKQDAAIRLLDGISQKIAPIKSWPVQSLGYTKERRRVFDQLFNGLTERQIFEFAEKLNIPYIRNNMQPTESILMDDELIETCRHFHRDDGYGGHNDVSCDIGHTKHERLELPCKGCPDVNVSSRWHPEAFLRGRVIETLMKAKDEQLHAEKQMADERKKKQEAEAKKLLAQLNQPILDANQSIVEQCEKLQTTVKEYNNKTLAEIYELTQGRKI
jgi:hypothetical protein